MLQGLWGKAKYLVDLALVTTLRHSTTPGTDWCSMAEYSPSVCSLMITVSMFLCLLFTPGRLLTWCVMVWCELFWNPAHPHYVGEQVELPPEGGVEALQLPALAVLGSPRLGNL